MRSEHARSNGREVTHVNIKRILCPIDFSDASAHAIDHAVAVASWCKARLTALHVYSPTLVSVPGVDLSGQGEATNDTDREALRTRTAAHCQAADDSRHRPGNPDR